MENIPTNVVLIQKDDSENVLEVRGPYSLAEATEILNRGHETLGGELYTQRGSYEWALRWEYCDCNETYWEINPIESEFVYPEHLE